MQAPGPGASLGRTPPVRDGATCLLGPRGRTPGPGRSQNRAVWPAAVSLASAVREGPALPVTELLALGAEGTVAATTGACHLAELEAGPEEGGGTGRVSGGLCRVTFSELLESAVT